LQCNTATVTEASVRGKTSVQSDLDSIEIVNV
jgi:hypothetical protein